jgi:hypothetical protein
MFLLRTLRNRKVMVKRMPWPPSRHIYVDPTMVQAKRRPLNFQNAILSGFSAQS